ncbi:hypothetical protein MMYC01_208263 [Madurella mycetomatis]|uniref:Uncharacterized protein n=1 Tax=Madurella mycetomatis TaxID=100816 RepID=A0A175VZ48_9PEZI|nr:hypothetical protein MMYC01_208263 [Madurella mycetomatis]
MNTGASPSPYPPSSPPYPPSPSCRLPNPSEYPLDQYPRPGLDAYGLGLEQHTYTSTWPNHGCYEAVGPDFGDDGGHGAGEDLAGSMLVFPGSPPSLSPSFHPAPDTRGDVKTAKKTAKGMEDPTTAHIIKKAHSRKRTTAPPGGAVGGDDGGDITMARDVVPSSWDPTHHPNPHHHVGAVSQKFESIEHNGLRNGYYRGPDEYPQVVHDADLYDRHGQNEDDDWDMCDDTGA